MRLILPKLPVVPQDALGVFTKAASCFQGTESLKGPVAKQYKCQMPNNTYTTGISVAAAVPGSFFSHPNGLHSHYLSIKIGRSYNNEVGSPTLPVLCALHDKASQLHGLLGRSRQKNLCRLREFKGLPISPPSTHYRPQVEETDTIWLYVIIAVINTNFGINYADVVSTLDSIFCCMGILLGEGCQPKTVKA